MTLAYVIGGIVLIAINLAVCIGLFRSYSYSRNQKIVQVLLVFLLPVAGAVAVWLFLRENTPLPPTNTYADTDDLKTVGMDAPGSYGSPD